MKHRADRIEATTVRCIDSAPVAQQRVGAEAKILRESLHMHLGCGDGERVCHCWSRNQTRNNGLDLLAAFRGALARVFFGP